MSNNNSFGGKLKKVLASICSFVVGASGVSQAKFNVGDNVSNVFCDGKKYVYNNTLRRISWSEGNEAKNVTLETNANDPIVFNLGEFEANNAKLGSNFIVKRDSYGLSFRLQAKLGEKMTQAIDAVSISWGSVATLCSYWGTGDKHRDDFISALGEKTKNVTKNQAESIIFFFNFVFELVTAEDKKNFTFDDILEQLKYLFRVSKSNKNFSPPNGVKSDDLENGLPKNFEFCPGDNVEAGYCMPEKGAFLAQLVRKLGESKVKKDLEAQITFLNAQVTELSKDKGGAEQQLAQVTGQLALAPGEFKVANEQPQKDVVTQTGKLVKAYNDLLALKNTLEGQMTDLKKQITELKKFRFGTFFGGAATSAVIGGAGFVAYKAGLFGRQGGKVRDIHGKGKRSNHGGNKVTKRSPGGNKVTKKPMRKSGGKRR